MAPIRSKRIYKQSKIETPEKNFISKLKGNEEIISPLSQLKELVSEEISYYTIKGNIESIKHSIYKVSYHPFSKSIISIFYSGMC
jgi:hypothetical protein